MRHIDNVCECTARPLALTSNQLLLTSTSAAAPLLVIGPSFPPRMQGPISMLPGAPIGFSGAPVAPPAPYSAKQSAGRRQHHTTPFRAPECRRAPHYSLWQECRGLVRARLMLVHLWPLQLGQCMCLVTCPGSLHNRPLCKLSLKSLPKRCWSCDSCISFRKHVLS